MLILAMETSAPGGGVALLEDGRLLADEPLGEGQRHGQALLPACEAVLRRSGRRLAELSGLAVSGGPGSYTGLRIGAMAAKAVGYAVKAPLAPVSSLAALALTAADAVGSVGDQTVIAVIQTSRRDEVFAAGYRLDGPGRVAELPGGEQALSPEEAGDMARQLATLAEAACDRLILAGNALVVYPEMVFRLTAGVPALPGGPKTPWSYGRIVVRPDLGVASARAVGQLGAARLAAGHREDPLVWQPLYLRRDEAHAWRRDQLIADAGDRSAPH